MSPQVLDRSVRGALLVAVMMSLTAACAPLSPAVRALADQGEASVLIRNGFVVPTGQLLRVDDMSVDCVIASEVFDQQEFNTAVSKRQHSSGSCTRLMPARRLSIQRASVRRRTTRSAPQPRMG
jgi:hypothetical protein